MLTIMNDDHQYDCLVAGGGTAGFAAAVTAAKLGLKTLLIEENGYLGGTATGAQISQLMGFAGGEAELPKKGILKDVLEALMKLHGSNGIETIYLCGDKDLDVPVIPYDSEILKKVMEDLVWESGAEVLFHTRIIASETKNGRIEALIIHNEEGLQRIQAPIVIDATFHGSVAAGAGCRWKAGDDSGTLQPGTLMFKMDGVDGERYDQVSQPERERLALQGIARGCLFVNTLLARPLPNGLYYFNMSRTKINPLDTRQWSRAEHESREQVFKISRFFIENVPGFEHAHLVAAGEFTGLRDSRRIMGKYVLKNEDVLESRDFDDGVVKSSYPIDVHDADGVSSKIVRPKKGIFWIPYRSMVTDEAANLILAGRCISTEYEAHACSRVMITCMRLGEAAGLAAALSREQGIQPAELDGRKLKKVLQP